MDDDAFCLGIVGDFGGDPGGPAARRFVTVDRDDFDTVMARCGVVFAAGVPNHLTPERGPLRVSLPLRSLDDFRPEALVAGVPELALLLRARATLPAGAGGSPAAVVPPAAPAGPASPQPASLLDQIIGGAEGPSRKDPLPALEEFVRAIVEPSLDRTDRGTLAAWQDLVDRRLGSQLREILHHPRFQALEAAWRSLDALVRETETGPDLVLRVLDLPRAALPAATAEGGLLDDLLGEEATVPGTVRCAVVVMGYDFGPEDVVTLTQVARLAARSGTAVVADARPELVGLQDFRELGSPQGRGRIGGDALRALRTAEGADHLALCVPRVLRRQPYGPRGDTVEGFPFDEDPAEHAHFLWGSPALAFGSILTRAFGRDGWDLDAGADATLEGLPLHVHRHGGEEHVLPCAEVLMSEQTIARLSEEGCMALASVRDQDRARFYGVGTLAGGTLPVGCPT